MNSHPTNGSDSLEVARFRAAIATIETLSLNLRTIRRGSFPTDVKRRIGEILRLCAEVIELLTRRLRESRNLPPIARTEAA